VRPPKRPFDDVVGPLNDHPVLDPGGPSNPTTPPVDPPSEPEGDHNDKHCKPGFPWWAVVNGIRRPAYSQTVVVREPVYVATPVAVEAQPVAPAVEPAVMPVAATQPALPQLTPGTEVSISASQLGAASGQVAMQVGDLTLPVEIAQWSDSAAVVRLPMMMVAKPMAARLMVFRADGTLARAVDFELGLPATRQL
jgi:hypothetical protein